MTTVRQLLDGKGRQVYSVGPQAPVLDAIRLMAEHRIGALLVMKGESLAGIVSERDYALKVILRGRGGVSPWKLCTVPGGPKPCAVLLIEATMALKEESKSSPVRSIAKVSSATVMK